MRMKDIQFTRNTCMYIKLEIRMCSMCVRSNFELWCMYSNNYAICIVIIAKKKSQYLTFSCQCRFL